ncbi:hypothetical protein GN156_32170, partial [bacterium LRH843]|nr:hypothetical protein [bacterium LRH843]
MQFGSSRSSDWLSTRYELCTVESKIELINEHDADYVFAPIAEGWYDRDAIRKFAPCEYDGILINPGPYQKEVLANLDLL